MRLKESKVMGMVWLGGLLIMCLWRPSEGATRQELQNEIANLNTKTTELQGKVSVLSQDQMRLISRYKATNATRGALFVVGVSTSTKGQTLQIPISFVPTSLPITSIQQDFVVPSSFTLVSVVAGPAAIAAGKNVQVNTSAGVSRLIVFGLNQTPIGEGVLAIATVRSLPTIPSGVYPIVTLNPVASDASGAAAPMSVTSGWIKL